MGCGAAKLEPDEIPSGRCGNIPLHLRPDVSIANSKNDPVERPPTESISLPIHTRSDEDRWSKSANPNSPRSTEEARDNNFPRPVSRNSQGGFARDSWKRSKEQGVNSEKLGQAALALPKRKRAMSVEERYGVTVGQEVVAKYCQRPYDFVVPAKEKGPL
eukprot:GEMP01124763.1.p1 GENE.GEMP01124763.1~~GEMP01124763.1.p1  ORF type:complete len:169 (+),score=32.74 GEMP01124763.1:30-509(+)